MIYTYQVVGVLDIWTFSSCSYLHAFFRVLWEYTGHLILGSDNNSVCFRYEFFRIAPLESGVNKHDESQKIANSIPKKLELFLTQKGQEDILKNLKEYKFLTNGRLLFISYY